MLSAAPQAHRLAAGFALLFRTIILCKATILENGYKKNQGNEKMKAIYATHQG